MITSHSMSFKICEINIKYKNLTRDQNWIILNRETNFGSELRVKRLRFSFLKRDYGRHILSIQIHLLLHFSHPILFLLCTVHWNEKYWKVEIKLDNLKYERGSCFRLGNCLTKLRYKLKVEKLAYNWKITRLKLKFLIKLTFKIIDTNKMI
jgi:hypothetical protein